MGKGGLLLIPVKVAAKPKSKYQYQDVREIGLSCIIHCGQVVAGFVHMVLTRGQTGLTVTQVGLLLKNADVWVGPGKSSITQQQNAEEVTGCCLA